MTAQQWGRVDDDGTVWVRTSDGERSVGQYPGATQDEALAYFGRKYDDLVAQTSLLEQRIAANQVSGADAETSVRKLNDAVREANAVGDLDALTARLAALGPVAQERRLQAEQARHEARAQAITERTVLVTEAEAISSVEIERIPWKVSGDRLRVLFDTWRTMQRDARLDKQTEDELWRRFSHARTTFDRKRRQHFGALDEQRDAAKATKEKLVAQAEQLAGTTGTTGNTDWASTANAFRDLMTLWKATGRAAPKDDDQLWARFRAAQEAFFAARTAANEQAETGLRDNLAVKEALLAEAEALLPGTDPAAARAALRRIQDRWEEAGKVPRADVGRVEDRLRAVEQALKDGEQQRWTRSNPQARARAEDAVTQLETTLASLRQRLAKAEAAGNQKAVIEAQQAIEAREEWLVQARQALAEFGG